MAGEGKTARPMCRHCGREPATRPRGLGWRCYYAPGVREMYPSGVTQARMPDPAVHVRHVCHTQEEVADLLGITRARVQQIENRAIWKLRQDPLMRRLAAELFGEG